MNQRTVLYEAWQMQCCGTPFRVGDMVQFPVLVWDETMRPPATGEVMDYLYEAHSDDMDQLFMLEGNVLQIKALFTHYQPSQVDPRLMLPCSEFTMSVDRADGWDDEQDGALLSAYIVVLGDCIVRAAARTDSIDR